MLQQQEESTKKANLQRLGFVGGKSISRIIWMVEEKPTNYKLVERKANTELTEEADCWLTEVCS